MPTQSQKVLLAQDEGQGRETPKPVKKAAAKK